MVHLFITVPEITLCPNYTTSETLKVRFQLSAKKYGKCWSMFNLSRTKIIRITDQIPITDPDYGSGISELGLRIQITDLDYRSGLQIWITDQDYRSGLQIWITDLDYRSGLQIWITDLDYRSGLQIRITEYGSG